MAASSGQGMLGSGEPGACPLGMAICELASTVRQSWLRLLVPCPGASLSTAGTALLLSVAGSLAAQRDQVEKGDGVSVV